MSEVESQLAEVGTQALAELKPSKRKGKRSIPWTRDLDILARLDVTATLMIQGAKAYQIADSTNVSLRTANRDIKRVRILWQRAAKGKVEERRQQSLAQLRAVRMHAWDRYTAKDKSGKAKNSPIWLRIILETERDIAKLEGLAAPTRTDITSLGEKVPVPVIYIPDNQRGDRDTGS